MMQIINDLLGLENTALGVGHMINRAVVIYLVGLALFKLNRRFMGMRTVFNFILYVFLGSIAAAGIVGQSPFFTIVGLIIGIQLINVGVLILISSSETIEYLVKGSPIIIVKNGEIQWNAMHRYFLTYNDLMSALRAKMDTENLNSIKTAILETNGDISFIKK